MPVHVTFVGVSEGLCVSVCMLLTKLAGDARLNSARTLASPKAFTSTHITGKSSGKMGRTPISFKYNFRLT